MIWGYTSALKCCQTITNGPLPVSSILLNTMPRMFSNLCFVNNQCGEENGFYEISGEGNVLRGAVHKECHAPGVRDV